MIDIYFVLSVEVQTVILILDVTNVCRGPRRRWRVILNCVSLFHLRTGSLNLHLSLPLSTAPEFDLDSRLATQLDTVNKSMDKKLEDMSIALMFRFSAVFDQFRADFNQTSFAEDPAVPGPSVSQTEPPSLPHPVSTKSREGLRFRVSGEDPVPHGSGLAQNFSGSARHELGAEAAVSCDPPPEDGESSQRPGSQFSSGFSYGGQAETESVFHPEDDDDEDRESIADPPVLNRTYARLVDFIYNRFAHSRPSASAMRV